MSMDQLMALVPIEAATLSTGTGSVRKSRWERSVVPQGKTSRFGNKEDKPYIPPPFVDLPPGLTPLQMDQFLREQRLDELTAKLEKGELEYGEPDIRPPSPPPAYDKAGNRTNTRDVRVRIAMVSEHQRLLEYVMANVPGFVPPGDFKPMKKIRKIIIPQDQYPEYNFMGLIIGPRGCNHKRLEVESGSQISIRGRGTQKEGKKTDHQTEEEAAMPQHIHIAADTEASIDKAVALIEPLLNPFHPMHEEFKKKGLEQLALVNGVAMAKIENRCNLCAATGHLSWECPEQEYQSFKKAEVKCALCGDKGHVTMDCKQAKGMTSEQLAEIETRAQAVNAGQFGGVPPPPPPTAESQKMDQEFSSFMSEVSGAKPGAQAAGNVDMQSDPSQAYSRRPGIGAVSTPPPGSSPQLNRGIPPPPPHQPKQAINLLTAPTYNMAAYGYAPTPTQNSMSSAYVDPNSWQMGYYGNQTGYQTAPYAVGQVDYAAQTAAAYATQQTAAGYATQQAVAGYGAPQAAANYAQAGYVDPAAYASTAGANAQFSALFPGMMAAMSSMMSYAQQQGYGTSPTAATNAAPAIVPQGVVDAPMPPEEPVAPPPSEAAPPPPGGENAQPPTPMMNGSW